MAPSYWPAIIILLCSSPLWRPEGVEGWGLSTVPSESECRPYIEKALKELSPETPQEAVDAKGSENTTPPSQSAYQEGSIEDATTKESIETDISSEAQTTAEEGSTETGTEAESSGEPTQEENEAAPEDEQTPPDETSESTETTEAQESVPEESLEDEEKVKESTETEEVQEETATDEQSTEGGEESAERDNLQEEITSTENVDETAEEHSAEETLAGTSDNELKSIEETEESIEEAGEIPKESEEVQEDVKDEATNDNEPASAEETPKETNESQETEEGLGTSAEEQTAEESAEVAGGEVTDSGEVTESGEIQEAETKESQESGVSNLATSVEETPEITESSDDETSPVSAEETSEAQAETAEEISQEEPKESVEEETATESSVESPAETSETESKETEASEAETSEAEASGDVATEAVVEPQVEAEVAESIDATPASEVASESGEKEPDTAAEATEQTEEQESTAEETAKEAEPTVEDQLTLEFEAPKIRRAREHIAEILKLTTESAEVEMLLAKTIDTTLKELKKLYDSAIKPLEILYKYRDLSNRHFGDPEIFSKPLILFMGPWSGGKSTIINYLLDNEFQASSLRTGAEPSPAYFNILMWGEREEVLDGTQLAADWTFSGLQKFGQGLLDRLRGLKLNNPLLEKVNIVEIPGILEIRKQVERLFPFNDACQWFIDRADIIFLVYDPSKLDVGPETEAILDQLKGREYQTRIILNKADQVKPEELMRVQGTLIWNISPLMSSQEPPILYSTSLWSVPYEQGAPTRLLHAQERAFLRDLRTAIDKRVENKIASARRFAVRVRNHAKMVDCYLTTYYNHKTFFGNRKKVADDIIEHPQNYHIYEGLSTLTNISRYDLPDPEVYRDFFRLNPVYDFQRLSDTCTYFRGCPINRLDVAIAYDLPELVGKYKKQAERVLEAAQASKS